MIHIKLFEEYDFEDEKSGDILRYHSFDIYDSLLYMETKIHMEHLVNGEWIEESVDTETFAKIRSDKNWKYSKYPFVEFEDWGPRGDDTFLYDFKNTVKNKEFGPSWSKFIECLVNGNIFSIITSRGHHPKNIRKAIEWLIYEYGLDNFKNLPIKNVDKSESFEDQMIKNLLNYHELFGTSPDYVIDEYLELCPIYTISSPYFKKNFGMGLFGFTKLTEEEIKSANYVMSSEIADVSKKIALRDFNAVVKEYADKLGVRAKYGFSDDDPKFVKAAADEFLNLKDKNTNIDYSVFDTGGDKKIKKFM